MFTKNDILDAGTFRIHVPAHCRPDNARHLPHYTYQVDYVEPKGRFRRGAWFVKLLPDDAARGIYLGQLDDFSGMVTTTKASKFRDDAFCLKLFNRVTARLWAEEPDLAPILNAGFGLESLTDAPAPVVAVPAVAHVPDGPDRHGRYGDENLDDFNERNALDDDEAGFTNGLTEQDSYEAEMGQALPPLPDAKLPPPARQPAPAAPKELDEELLRRILPRGDEPWARRR